MSPRISHALLTTVLMVSTLAVGCTSSPKATATTAEDNGRKAAANFSLPDSDGVKVALADYKGKVVLLNFWATWCGPCKIEIPTGGGTLPRGYGHQEGIAVGLTETAWSLVTRLI